MRNEQAKKATIHALDLMIRHADKGPSGFWVEDHEGCGNPAVFPEFEEGLKRGRLVQKEHGIQRSRKADAPRGAAGDCRPAARGIGQYTWGSDVFPGTLRHPSSPV